MKRAAPIALLAAALAQAQQSDAPPPKDPKALAPVEVTGQRASDEQQRRQSTAAAIVVGREEIERYGDATVGELLKRLPGVTMGGRPGRGGAIRMRGLGNGYTQILLDGERVPPGFQFDALDPNQIERIEILRAPTAETGARAIAGTINIVMREGWRARQDDLRITTGYETTDLQPAVAWTHNGGSGSLAWSGSLSAQQTDRRSDTVETTEQRDTASGALTSSQTDTGRVLEHRHNLHANGRLQWRGERGASLTLMPILVVGAGTTVRDSTLVQPVGAPTYDTAHVDGDGSFALARLNASAVQPFGDGQRIEWRTGAAQSRSRQHSLRTETLAGATSRLRQDDSDTLDRTLSAGAKATLGLGETHTVVAGIEAELNRRTDTRTILDNGAAVAGDFGDDLGARALRTAVYAQDEWAATPQWALQAGLRWEGIATRGSAASGAPDASNRSSVWTPLLHAVWKPEPRSRDQLRISLTRSYRAPSLGDLIARPLPASRVPLDQPNTASQPDRIGNPDLKPELATGIDIAVEHYPPGGGILSANLFHRRLKDYMRRSITLQPQVPWTTAPVPRWVSQPVNIGGAVTQGLELEAKFRLRDLLPQAPAIDVRANASLFRSRVDGVPAPDNRIDQQPSATANLGADWRIGGRALTIGGNLNITPAYTTRLADAQTAQQGRKQVLDVYALWTVRPDAALRLTASNADPRDFASGGSLEAGGVRETTTTVAPTHVNLQLRLELKL